MRKRILVVGRAVRHTGFARVLHSLLEPLCSDFDIIHFGIDYRGPAIESPWRILPNRRLGDPLGVEQLPAILDEHRPDVVFMCHDYYLYGAHAEALRGAAHRPWVVFYCPIEWPFPDERLACLADVDRLVAYTDFGRAILASALRQVGVEKHIEILPHGVDIARFRPLCGASTAAHLRASRRYARTRLWPDRPELQRAFIVLNANRNCPRKRIDLTLEAFAAFAQDRKNVWLYLHMGMQDAGVDVTAYAHSIGVADRLLVSTAASGPPAFDDERLNLVYNACDVGVNTATGEGFGLIALEHGATGAAQAMPDHSACAELWRDAAQFVPIRVSDPRQLTSAEYGVVRAADVAVALARLADDPARRDTLALGAYALACQPRFNWHGIAARWRRILAEV